MNKPLETFDIDAAKARYEKLRGRYNGVGYLILITTSYFN